MLDHIELYVSDIKKSREFYSWFLERLGYEVFQQWEEGFSYKKDSFYLVFVQVRKKYLHEKYNRAHVGLNHLAFAVQEEKIVDSFRKELLSKGVKLLYDERFPYAGGENHYALYFEDPDGIKLEIVKK